VLVVLAIYSQAVLELHQRLLTQAVLVAVAQAISVLAVTHQVTLAVLVVTVAAVVAVLTTQAHQVLAVTAYFIFTTKGNKCLHLQ
jgi:hypothetical protein